MRTIKTNVYALNELAQDAKQKAIQNFREGNLDYEWWEWKYEDATEIGKILGIDIDRIYFSGFWSQGDGACFEGSYYYRKGCLKDIKAYAPKDTELHDIAERLTNIARVNFYQINASIKQSGHYYHSGCTDITVSDDRHAGWYEPANAEDLRDVLRDFMGWIYSSLEKEHDYLQSDEVIAETIEVNEYEFTADGAEI